MGFLRQGEQLVDQKGTFKVKILTEKWTKPQINELVREFLRL